MMMAAVALERRQIGSLLLAAVRFLRLAGVAGLAGYIAGVLVAGGGSRLAMRIVSLTAGHEHYGRLTEADARVGEITAEGTLFLFFFGGVVGLSGTLLFLASRQWLPLRGWRLGLAFGGVMLAAFGPIIIDGGNFDFSEFGSPTLNVLMFASLFLLFGLLITCIFEWLDQRIPASPPRGIALLLWGALLVVGLGSLKLGLLMLAAITFGLQSFTSVMGFYLLFAAPLLAHWLARRKPARTVALYVAAFPVLVGGLYLLLQLQAIYTA
jgi:hypothetical protein